MADMNILDLLGSDSKGVPYYLHPLNLVWSDEGADYDLTIYRQVADKLALDKRHWG